MTLEAIDSAALPVLAWVGTYLLHSTLLIGLVWALARFVPRIDAGIRDSMWKAALVGGVLTASLQLGAGLQPGWGATLTDEVSPPAVKTLDAPMRTPSATGYVFMSAGPTVFELRSHAAASTPARAAAELAPEPEVSAGATATLEPRAATILLGFLALGAAFALFRLGATVRRLGGQLRGRRDVLEDPLLETFLALCQRAGVRRRVRLTAADGLGSPVALWRREICVPERAVEGLSPPQQESMLAHELAHVLRRDPWWLALAAVVESIFFFQPLNRLARRNMQDTAELICDDFAVRMTGSGVHLAKCLAEVATWIDEGAVPLASPMATGDASSLVRRIKRLLADRQPGQESGSRRVAAVVALLVAMVLAAPAVSVASPRADAELDPELAFVDDLAAAELEPFTFDFDFEGIEVDLDPDTVILPPDVQWSFSFDGDTCDDDRKCKARKRKLARTLRKRQRRARAHARPSMDHVREIERRERELEQVARQLEQRARELERRSRGDERFRIRIDERDVAALVERALEQQAAALERVEEAQGRVLQLEDLDPEMREKIERAVRRAMEELGERDHEMRRKAPRAPAPPAKPHRPRVPAAPPAPPRAPAEPSAAPAAPGAPPVLIPL